MQNISISENQKGFIEFLVESGALLFGEFTLKSGRLSPYFVNTGKFDDGRKISALGKFYAGHIEESGLGNSSVIFGPAYKGIPLAVATSISLARDFNRNIGFSFDRKEAKTHGDTGMIVGKKIGDGDKVVIVEDVITAGTTMREVLPLLNSLAKVEISGVVIAVDRMERGTGSLSAVQEAEQSLGIKVFPIVSVLHITQHLSRPNKSGLQLSPDQIEKMQVYSSQYGVQP